MQGIYSESTATVVRKLNCSQCISSIEILQKLSGEYKFGQSWSSGFTRGHNCYLQGGLTF